MFRKVGILSVVLALASPLHAAVDHSIWENILKLNVDRDGFVDYAGIRTNRGGDLYQYLSTLETADVKSLPENERLAFWINAYNAHMIKSVLARPKLRKVDEDFDLFDRKFKIARYNLSLNDIEHRILRSDPDKGGPISGLSFSAVDPRIHFVLNCAALSCPKLSNRAYQGKSIQEKLQEAAVTFANDPTAIRIENDKLIMPTILKWFEKDFQKAGGVPAFVSALTDEKLRADAEEIDIWLQSDYPSKVDFQYDWTVNDIKNKKK